MSREPIAAGPLEVHLRPLESFTARKVGVYNRAVFNLAVHIDNNSALYLVNIVFLICNPAGTIKGKGKLVTFHEWSIFLPLRCDCADWFQCSHIHLDKAVSACWRTPAGSSMKPAIIWIILHIGRARGHSVISYYFCICYSYWLAG